jgi:hypothetical protein
MWNRVLSSWLRWMGGTPCFQVYGKTQPETGWRILDIYATHRRDADSSWPLWRGTCITWTSNVIVIGWDFARQVAAEQVASPVNRQRPIEVCGGRLHDASRRKEGGGGEGPSASEILAHECGHTLQALRLGPLYLPLAGPLTLFREGPHLWNYFENRASELGQFGGLVEGSLCRALLNPDVTNL